ncbi:MAG TPA: hypothetical protein VFF79_03215 [Conexibacter sp.]|nr:hypothetical protein [Conexibacter sp.]
MPPETPPPDDARRPSPTEANVVDPEVLAERRAQRAEQAEQSAARRAADAQVLAAQLARERARLEAERDASRAEAAAAREGADAAIAEARHLKGERDELRAALDQAREERDALAAAREQRRASAPAAVRSADGPPKPAATNGNGTGVAGLPAAWPTALRRELLVARGAAGIQLPAAAGRPAAPVPGLARERRLVALRVEAGPAFRAAPPASQRRGDRAAPITALALERERSSRLQAQLDGSLAVQRELHTHIAALQRSVHQRVEAERRIEVALRRVREELTAANLLAVRRAEPPAASPDADSAPEALAADTASGPPRAAAGTAAPAVVPTPAADAPPATLGAADLPAAPATVPADVEVAAVVAPAAAGAAPEAPGSLDPLRLHAARERLRATAPPLAALPTGTPAPWLTAALRRLLTSEPETAGRIAVGLLPAQGLAAQQRLRYDLLLAGRGCFAVDVVPGTATVTPRTTPRPRSARDLSIVADGAGFARLLHGRRSLRRPARVRGGRRALRELRRLARAPLGMRDLGSAGVTLDPALALRLVALAIDPEATRGERFAIAHAPLAGGPVDAWLRIADGTPPLVLDAAPAEPLRLTLRCTRGALLALIAGVEPPPGEAGTADGDEQALALLRSWIASTEHPAA